MTLRTVKDHPGCTTESVVSDRRTAVIANCQWERMVSRVQANRNGCELVENHEGLVVALAL